MSTRCGIGYDLHRLEAGRKLIVGGIELPFDKGTVGHSDGDVLAHAVCDALLGAAGLGDIGTHFPDSDPKWKGANSLLFLEHAKKLLEEKKLAVEHVDAVVILEKPKLGPHFPRMREALAKSLGVPLEMKAWMRLAGVRLSPRRPWRRWFPAEFSGDRLEPRRNF